MRIIYLSNYLIFVSTAILLVKASFTAIAAGRLDGIISSVAYAESEKKEKLEEKSIETSGVEQAENTRTDSTKKTSNEPLISGLFSGVSQGEQAVLLALRSRAKELSEYEKMLHDKENLLLAVEENFEMKISKMRALKDDLTQVLKSYQSIRKHRVDGIVKVYENMKPQEAARIFENLDSDTLLDVVGEMSESKLAPILSKMATTKAKELTVMLANMYKFKEDTKENDCICLS